MNWSELMLRSASRRRRRTFPTMAAIERLEDRVLLSGVNLAGTQGDPANEVVWDRDERPPEFTATAENGSLRMEGGNERDYVLMLDIEAQSVHTKAHEKMVVGQRYVEIQHRDASGRLRRGWVHESLVTDSFIFFGRGGNDHFQYINTSLGGRGESRRGIRIIAYGGPGEDSLHGYRLNDIIFGEEDDDDLIGDLGNDLLVGGTGNDRLWGDGVTRTDATKSDDVDYLLGGDGRDSLYGWQGGDFLNGGDFWKVADGDIDELAGGQHGDCFYTESHPLQDVWRSVREGGIKYEEEVNFQARRLVNNVWVNEDMRHLAIGNTSVWSPSYYDWLAMHDPHASQTPWPFNVHAFANDRPAIAQAIGTTADSTDFEILGFDDDFNCAACAVGRFGGGHQPGTNVLFGGDPFFELFPHDLARWDRWMRLRGFDSHDDELDTSLEPNVEKVALFIKPNGNYHLAVQLADGTWMSKLGDGNTALSRHRTLQNISQYAGSIEGDLKRVYYRERPTFHCGSPERLGTVAYNPYSPSVVTTESAFGQFDAPQIAAIFPQELQYPFVVEGDFNGDGASDFAAFANNNNNGQWYVAASNGLGGYAVTPWAQNVTIPQFWDDFFVGDVTGDGVDDLVGYFGGIWNNANPAASMPGAWWVLASNPETGAFTPTATSPDWPLDFLLEDIFTGDFNGDLLTDVGALTLGFGGPNSAQVLVSLADGNGGFTPMQFWTLGQSLPNGEMVDSVHLGDFDGNGRTDLAVLADKADSSGSEWWVGLSSGSGFGFSLWAQWSITGVFSGVDVGDFNGDGRSDIVGRSIFGGLIVGLTTLNNGLLNFGTSIWETGLNTTAQVRQIVVADFNNDLIDDVLTYYDNGDLEVAESRGLWLEDFESSVWSNLGFGFIDELFASVLL